MSADDLRRALRQVTDARVLLGRAGAALPTRAWLDFQLAHARARDAVLTPADLGALAHALRARGLDSLVLSSQAHDRTTYLTRPDLGRLPDEASLASARDLRQRHGPVEALLIATGGLSATALARHGEALLAALHRSLTAAGLSVGPVLLVDQARVAIGDPLGAALDARLSVVVVGERPGLSADDSLGVYLTFAPRPGRTDAERNCVSNVRPPAGLGCDEAARRVARLATEALRRQLSGVDLKDDAPPALPARPELPEITRKQG